MNGTCYQGELVANFEDLKAIFGEPLGGSADGKVSNEWTFEFEDGSVCSIHDWKENGEFVEQPCTWTIGGHFKNVVEKIQNIYNEKMVELSSRTSEDGISNNNNNND